MNAINRSVMLVVALILMAVTILSLLVALGVLSAQTVNAYTGYQSAVVAMSALPDALSGGGAERVVQITGVVAAAAALTLLLAELSYKPKGVKSILIRGESGWQTRLTSRAARRLFEAAALGAGASSATAKLISRRKGYGILCKIEVPALANMSGVAGAVRQNIERISEQQEIPLGGVEVTVKGVLESADGSVAASAHSASPRTTESGTAGSRSTSPEQESTGTGGSENEDRAPVGAES